MKIQRRENLPEDEFENFAHFYINFIHFKHLELFFLTEKVGPFWREILFARKITLVNYAQTFLNTFSDIIK
jgi:hypothetical protein